MLFVLCTLSLMLALMPASLGGPSGLGGASAQTFVGVGLDATESGHDWSETGSTYIVNKTIYVEKGETLTIGPNVTVLFERNCTIAVNGTLEVKGDEAHPVIFDTYNWDPQDPGEEDSYWGIVMGVGSDGTIDRAIFRNATKAIEVYDAEVTITNSEFYSVYRLAPIYADFHEGGSIYVEACYIEARSSVWDEGAITITASALAYGDDISETEVMITIVDNEITSTSEHYAIYIAQGSFAEDDAVSALSGTITIVGNTIHENAKGSDTIHINRMAMAIDNGSSSMNVGVMITDNVVRSNTQRSLIHIEENVLANNSSVVAMNGDIVILANTLEAILDEGDAAAKPPKGLELNTSVEVNDHGEAKIREAAFFEHVTIVDNTFSMCGSAIEHNVRLHAAGHGKILCMDGALIIYGNIIDGANDAFVISQDLAARDSASLYANLPVMIAHNEVKSDISACKMQVDLLAADDSVLEREGEFRMEHNSCGMEDGMTVEYALDVRAEGYGEATVNAPVTISENSGHDFQMDRTLSAQGDAAIYAYMPVCFEYNYLKGHIGISSSLHAGSGNATVLAEGDVLVDRNFVECDQADGGALVNVSVDVVAECTGPQQDCVASYNADVRVCENELTARLQGSSAESGISVSVNILAGGGSVAGPFGGSFARATFGDVLVEENMVAMFATPTASPCCVCVDVDVQAISRLGLESYVTMGKVSIGYNELYMAGGKGHGICFNFDRMCANAEGEDSVAIVIVDSLTVQDNLIEMTGDDSRGIDIHADGCVEADGGGSAGARTLNGMTVSNNQLYILGSRGIGICFVTNQDCLADGAEVRFDGYMDIIGNYMEVSGVGSIGISIERSFLTGYIDSWIEMILSVSIECNEVVMFNAASGQGMHICSDVKVAPGSYGLSRIAVGIRIVDNTIDGGYDAIDAVYLNGCSDAEVSGTTFRGSQTGLRIENCTYVVVDGNAFLENGRGVKLDNCTIARIYDSFFSKNDVGLEAQDCDHLFLETCYFYLNGDGAELTDVDGVVRDNTFYMNLNDGLRTASSSILLINGEYEQNGCHGIVVIGGSVDWEIDGEALVHFNDVYFAGEMIIRGKLVIEHVANFVLLLDERVRYGIYNGAALLTIAEGGCLEAYASHMYADNNDPWYFRVSGDMFMVDCIIEGAFEVYLASTSNVEMFTTHVIDSYGNGIRIDGCSPSIRNCWIMNSAMDGIYIDGGSPMISGCIIVGNVRGMYAYESCLDHVIDNVMLLNGHGIYAELTNGTVQDNIMMFNGIEMFLLECDLDVRDNQFGYGRLIDMGEPLASALMQLIHEFFGAGSSPFSGASLPFVPGSIIAEALVMYQLDGSVGIYAIDSCVRADGNEYGKLQTAVYLIRSDMSFSDTIRTSTFHITYDNGTRTLSIPFTVYDGIYAIDSTLSIHGASFQVVDDAILLEGSTALMFDAHFDAGGYGLCLMRDSEAAVCGPIDRYAVLDTSRLYRLGEMTIKVTDQDGWAIGGVHVVIEDARGRVWSDGVTAKDGTIIAHAPVSLETKDGVNASLGKSSVTASYNDQTSTSTTVDVGGDMQLKMVLTVKKGTILGMSPLVFGALALVIMGVIVGAIMLVRKR